MSEKGLIYLLIWLIILPIINYTLMVLVLKDGSHTELPCIILVTLFSPIFLPLVIIFYFRDKRDQVEAFIFRYKQKEREEKHLKHLKSFVNDTG